MSTWRRRCARTGAPRFASAIPTGTSCTCSSRRDDGREDYSEPVLEGEGASDYERYLRTDELLSLQKTPEQRAHRDELLFQTVHQSSELWLKLAWTEVERGDAAAGGGASSMRRSACSAAPSSACGSSTRSWTCSSRCRRGSTRATSGPYSATAAASTRPASATSAASRRSLGEAFHKLVPSEGLSIVELYRAGREFEELYQLAELLIEWDERVASGACATTRSSRA